MYKALGYSLNTAQRRHTQELETGGAAVKVHLLSFVPFVPFLSFNGKIK